MKPAQDKELRRGLAVAALILREAPTYTMAVGADPIEWMARIIEARAKDGNVDRLLAQLDAKRSLDPALAPPATPDILKPRTPEELAVAPRLPHQVIDDAWRRGARERWLAEPPDEAGPSGSP